MAPMSTAGTTRRRATALALVAAWAIAVPWAARAMGQRLDVPTRLEVIDHVVPGALVAGCCAALLHDAAGSLLRLGALALACLAGVWITATHITLVPEALDGVSPWGAALLHLSAGPPVVVVSLWLLLTEDRP